MKKSIAAILAGALCLSALTACGGGTSSSDSSAAANTGDSDKVITVGATPTPHAEILNAAKDALEAEGYTLKVVEFTDYVQPNTALVDGDLDANYFQHTPYLNNFNKENGTDLVAAFDMHYEPFGIYAGKTASIEELADGASVAIPNDGSNETRALLLLQDAGLIKLKDGIDPTSDATKLDITENPKNLDIQEIAAEQLPRSLADVDLAVINGNYALQADLNAAEDSLITENPDCLPQRRGEQRQDPGSQEGNAERRRQEVRRRDLQGRSCNCILNTQQKSFQQAELTLCLFCFPKMLAPADSMS